RAAANRRRSRAGPGGERGAEPDSVARGEERRRPAAGDREQEPRRPGGRLGRRHRQRRCASDDEQDFSEHGANLGDVPVAMRLAVAAAASVALLAALPAWSAPRPRPAALIAQGLARAELAPSDKARYAAV